MSQRRHSHSNRSSFLLAPTFATLAGVTIVSVTILGVIVLAPPPAAAQQKGSLGRPSAPGQQNHPAIQRYNRTAKGANVEEWKRRMSDEDPRVRMEAVESLGTKGGDEAIQPLVEATSDEDPRVRMRAIDHLGTLHALAATPVLMQLLFLTDVSRDEKLRVLSALGRIADPGTSERLVGYAKSISDDDLACRAVFALGEIGNPASMQQVASLHGSRPGTEMDRLVTDATAKITIAAETKPVEQPTLLELEKKMAPQKQP